MIVYDGPSMLNGKPIVAIVTGMDGRSRNDKTGPMAQLWILPQEVPPHIAIQLGSDDSVCGNCPARGKWCYVTVHQAPNQVYKAWLAGSYPQYSATRLVGVSIRFGAYGDPAALPLEVLERLASAGHIYTGYTHQWRDVDPAYAQYCMASCDSLEDYHDAKAKGYRTFRVTESLSTRQPNEALCPASDEAGKKLQCIDCGACDGRRRSRVKGDIVIQVHGTKGKVSHYEETIRGPGSRQPGREVRGLGRASAGRRGRSRAPVPGRTQRALVRGRIGSRGV